jgi:hypothetical protein
MKSLISIAILLLTTLTATVYAADPHECGAAWDIDVGLRTTFYKMVRGVGPMESREIRNWAYANELPDVTGGTVTIGNVNYKKPTGKEYIRLSMMFLENEGGRDRVKLATRLERLTPDGSDYEEVMSNSIHASSIEELSSSGIKAEIKKWIETMQGVLIKNLMPTKITYTLSKHVIDAEHPEKIEIKVTKIEDKYGEIRDNGKKKYFCIDFDYKEADHSSSIGTKKVKKILSSPVIFKLNDMKEMSKKGCTDDLDYCSRPIGKFDAKLTKGFGAMWDGKLLKNSNEKKERITIVCPINIEIPEPPVMVFIPGDTKNVSFRVTTLDDEPAANMIIKPITLSPGSFGRLSLNVDATDLNGFGMRLKLSTKRTAQEGLTGEVKMELCKHATSADLGKDESGNPIPWDLKAVQPVKISKMPMVRLNLRSHHKFVISSDFHNVSDNGERHEKRNMVIDETMTLDVEDARLNERIVYRNHTDDMGFKGTMIEYRGHAKARVSFSKPKGAVDVVTHRGFYQSKECGRSPFDFVKRKVEHNFMVKRPSVNVLIYYRHYIPAADSSIRKHPLEGLAMIQTNPMAAAATYLNASTYRNRISERNSCGGQINTSPAPRIPVPLIVSNYFAINTWIYMDDCYGMEEVTLPLKESDYMSATLRKWNVENQEFDSIHLSKNINLGMRDKAECWDIPRKTRSEWHDPNSTFVKGNFRYDHTAELISGNFDFSVE